MKHNINSMNKTWRTVGIVALAAGALVYPAMRLVKYVKQRRKNKEDGGQTNTKAFSPSLLGNHKPHRRKVEANGQTA